MAKTILICGHGPGISAAVAKKFGAAGFDVALVARSADKLQAAAAVLSKAGVRAAAFPTDMGDPAAVTALVAKVRQELGPVTVLHWNGYAAAAGDVTTAPIPEVRRVLDVGITGLVAAVQAALPDLRAQKNAAAVLITGGGFAFYEPAVDAAATNFGAMGLAITKAAQHKLAGLLAEKLGREGIYVGEVVVTGLVKGTAFDSGSATLEASAIADKFFEIYSARAPRNVVFG
jgi:NADP-dependent 3-hydroxy acid dehydrogenase YdfG